MPHVEHPLENPSLAPFGFVTPLMRQRLEYEPSFSWAFNHERLIGKLWTKANRLRAAHPLPIPTIVHEILPAQAKANQIRDGDFLFDGLPYVSRDVLVLSSIVQWLGTNIGRAFLSEDKTVSQSQSFHPEREFVLKLEHYPRDLVAFWTHVCSKDCKRSNVISLGSEPHFFSSKKVSPRERALADGLMRWLGRPAGRAFIAEYHTACERRSVELWKRAPKLTA